MKREMSKDELKVFKDCLGSLTSFLDGTFGNSYVWKFYEIGGRFILSTLKRNSNREMQEVGYVCDYDSDLDSISIGCSKPLGVASDKLENSNQLASYHILKALRALSQISIRVKKVEFATNTTFSRGYISRSKEEVGSYNVMLW